MILAAGEGRRMGGNKAIMQFHGRSFLETIATAMLNCGLTPVLAVLGADAESNRESFKNLKINFVINKNWQSGQFSSLKSGLKALPEDIPGVMISLVDHPNVKIETYILLCDIFMEYSDKIILPIHKGKRGHPIIIPEILVKEILGAPDSSILKEIIRKHSGLVYEQLVDDPGILQDIDTQNDLEKISKT